MIQQHITIDAKSDCEIGCIDPKREDDNLAVSHPLALIITEGKSQVMLHLTIGQAAEIADMLKQAVERVGNE